MTIYQVKRIHLDHFPDSHFFDRDTMKSFRVSRVNDWLYTISAPIHNRHGMPRGFTEQYFDSLSGALMVNDPRQSTGGKPLGD